MKIYWVVFGIFSIHSAVVNSMGVNRETGVVESLRRIKRADEKQTIVDSAATKRADSDTKTTKDEKERQEKEHPSKEHNSKPNTPSNFDEKLTTTTLSMPILTTTRTPKRITSTHGPIEKKLTDASKVTVQTVEQLPEYPHQTIPFGADNQHFRPPLPFYPEQFAPIADPHQSSYGYREGRIPHARNANEDYNLGLTYPVARDYHQFSPNTYSQPTVFAQQSPCGSNVLISCQPTAVVQPCSSYQPSYHIAAPSYHDGVPSYYPQTSYQTKSLPNSGYREAEQNGLLAEEPFVGRIHRYHHRTTQAPKRLDQSKAQTTEIEQIKQTEKNNYDKPDIVKHLKVQNKTVKDDTPLVGAPLIATILNGESTTEDPTQEVRRMQSAEMSKKDQMQTEQMPSSMVQSGQQIIPQTPTDQTPSSLQRNQQVESSQIPSNQMQSSQQMPAQILSDQMQHQELEISQMQPNQNHLIHQQMMNMPINPLTQQRLQMEISQMQGQQMIPQQMMNMQMNPLTLDPQLMHSVNMKSVHDGTMLGMLNPMIDDPASQSAGGSPQQMFWEPNGLYYRLV